MLSRRSIPVRIFPVAAAAAAFMLVISSAPALAETGVVKWFNESKGFGEITEDKTKKNYFVHRSNTERKSLREGEKVQSSLKKFSKGLQAVAVKSLPAAANKKEDKKK